MNHVAFYAAFVATVISILSLVRIALRGYDPAKHTTLSEIVADKRENIIEFRVILWICGTLFTITVLSFIVPRVTNGTLLTAVWLYAYACEILIGAIPAQPGIQNTIHRYIADGMALGMLAITYLFMTTVKGIYVPIEIAAFVVMSLLIMGAVLHPKKFIFYEMPFIFLSHISVLIAAVALR